MAEETKLKDEKKGSGEKTAEEPAKKTASDDDVMGKAYDGRLMRRMMQYLRPYKLQTTLSAVSIVIKAGSDVAGPFLVKIAVDTYLTPPTAEKLAHPSWAARHLSTDAMTGVTELALIYLGTLLLTFSLEFLQTYLMQWTGRRSCSTCAARSSGTCRRCIRRSSITIRWGGW